MSSAQMPRSLSASRPRRKPLGDPYWWHWPQHEDWKLVPEYRGLKAVINGYRFGYPSCCVAQYAEDMEAGRKPMLLRGWLPTGSGAFYIPCEACCEAIGRIVGPEKEVRAAQRNRALAKANEVRWARARLKAQIRELPVRQGLEFLANILTHEPPSYLDTARVGDLILCVDHVGEYRKRKILARSDVIETKKVGKLTERQLECIAYHLVHSSSEGPVP